MKQAFLKILMTGTLLVPMVVLAQDVVVTRYFSGHWDQVQHESQGLILQIVDEPGGGKRGVAYWFTYADDMESAWMLGVGPVSGNLVQLDLFRASGVGFLQENSPGDAMVTGIGTMEIEFGSCDAGTVTFSTSDPSVGSGSFPIERLTSLYNASCSGGVSDDTPAGVLITEQRIELVPARDGIVASGHADFEERPDRTEFEVEAEDLPDGSYRIVVGGVDRGELVISLGQGETEFRSPVEPGKLLLTFDPRGQVVDVRDSQGTVLTSGDVVFTGGDGDGDDDNGDDDNGGDDNGGDDDGDDNGGDDDGGDDNGGDDNGGSIDFGILEIEVELENTGIYPLASGDAELEGREDRAEFSVEIEDVPEGFYDLVVGGELVGTLQATLQIGGVVEGELEFRDPVEPGKVLLDFDPRGKKVEVREDGTTILEVDFPNG